jgi:hypothetical protein
MLLIIWLLGLSSIFFQCSIQTLWVKFPLLDPLTTFRSYKALPSAPPSQLLPSKCTASLAPTWLCRPSVGSGGNNNEHSSGMAGTQQQRHSPPRPSPISIIHYYTSDKSFVSVGYFKTDSFSLLIVVEVFLV